MISYSVFPLTFTVYWNTLQLFFCISFKFTLKNKHSFLHQYFSSVYHYSVLVFRKHFFILQYTVQESKSGISVVLRGNELQKDKNICNFLFLDQATGFSEYLI